MKNKKLSNEIEEMDCIISYLWEDKKRHFGLPLSFTKYALSNDRLFEDKGLLISRHNEVLLYRVRDISISISLWQRLFGEGNIKIYSADSTSPVLYLYNIKKPLFVKEMIHKCAEKAREEKGVSFGEYIGGTM